jgi:hypothetical protein
MSNRKTSQYWENRCLLAEKVIDRVFDMNQRNDGSDSSMDLFIKWKEFIKIHE